MRTPDEPDPDGSPDPSEPDPGGRVTTTAAGSLIGLALAGLVLGWLVRPVSVRLGGTAPTVSWLPALALGFVAVAVGWLAFTTYRLLHRRAGRLRPHHAVNRLVMGKTGALVGALVAGGYAGYAISWLGLTGGALVRARIVHSGAAGVAAIVLVVGSLLLERACKVRTDREDGDGSR